MKMGNRNFLNNINMRKAVTPRHYNSEKSPGGITTEYFIFFGVKEVFKDVEKR